MTIRIPAPLRPRLPRRLDIRLRVLSLLMLAPLVAVSAVSVVGLAITRSSASAVGRAQEQQRQVDVLRASVEHVISIGETYLASGNPEDTFAMAGAVSLVTRDLDALATMPSLQPTQPRLVATTVAAWRASAAVRAEVDSWAPFQDTPLVQSVADRFTQSLQAVVDGLDALRAANATRIASLRNTMETNQVTSAVVVGAALLAGVIAALALSRRLSRSILVPLRRLHAATERVAAGQSTDPLPSGDDDELGHLAAAFNTMSDRLRERQEQVALRERRLAALVENASDGILLVSRFGAVEFATPSLQKDFGIADRSSTDSLASTVHPDDLDPVIRAYQRVLAESTGSAQIEARLKHADGSWRHVWARISNHLADPAVGGIVLNITDVSERHRYEQQLTWQALHDPLTGLANRELLRRRLDVAHGDRDATRSHSLLYLDLDDFKRVNDTLGHENGDLYLGEIAQRIGAAVRPQDLVVRIGGDEFAVLLDGAGDEQALAAAVRLLDALHRPLTLAGREMVPAASLGVATAGISSTTVESLLGDADLAMYFAKRRDKGGICRFEASMRRELVEQVQLGEDLRGAIAGGQITVAYQPVVRLDDGTVAAVEALARWEHPVHGAIPPTVFVPLAEQLRLVSQLDELVLRTACRQLRAWMDRGLVPIRVAVNISGSELANPDLPERVQGVLDECGIAPRLLELELTESAAVAESEAELAVVNRLKELGVHLSIDDFGTGYSALGRLRSLPFDTLKVDKAFVDALGDPEQGDTLVETILDMARSLGLEVIAEGVESAQQAAFLRDQDCALAQGYYFSRPVTPDVIEAMLSVDGGAMRGGVDRRAVAD